MHSSTFANLIRMTVAALLVTCLSVPAWAMPDISVELLQRGLSHLAPHLQLTLPTEDAGLRQPPALLLLPIKDENEDVAKGFDPERELILSRALMALPLRQRLMKVAVASSGTRRLGLIKFQAGDMRTGKFRANDLQADAVSALQVAFRLPLGLEEVDLWSVLPGDGRGENLQQPVFSLCADRARFLEAANAPKEAKEVLSELGLIRFSPEFLRYAGLADANAQALALPRNAWSMPPMSDSWPQQVAAARQDPRLQSASMARVVVQIPVTDNSVGLTIDDGPHPLITPLFLDTLRQYGVKATFFVVGEKVEECPELLRRIAEDGHEIGNHTYSHPRLGQVSDVQALSQIRACALTVGRVSGQLLHLLRPPGGGLAPQVLRAASASNSTIVLWTNNTNDWLKPSPEEIAANALRDVRPGAIILMHQGELNSYRALPLIIEGLHQRGLRAAPIGEMLERAPVAALPITTIMQLYKRHQLGLE